MRVNGDTEELHAGMRANKCLRMVSYVPICMVENINIINIINGLK